MVLFNDFQILHTSTDDHRSIRTDIIDCIIDCNHICADTIDDFDIQRISDTCTKADNLNLPIADIIWLYNPKKNVAIANYIWSQWKSTWNENRTYKRLENWPIGDRWTEVNSGRFVENVTINVRFWNVGGNVSILNGLMSVWGIVDSLWTIWCKFRLIDAVSIYGSVARMYYNWKVIECKSILYFFDIHRISKCQQLFRCASTNDVHLVVVHWWIGKWDDRNLKRLCDEDVRRLPVT